MKIKIKNKNKKMPDWLLKEVGNNKILAKILYNRGIDTEEKLRKFLYPSEYKATSPKEFFNMKDAVNKILKAVTDNKKIIIYGDYDVDGITATTILVSFFEKLQVEIDYHIPDRFNEGYGMNKNVIKSLAENDVDLIITCDCGISNFEEIQLAKELGIEVIVTDHHNLPEKLPPADVILNPKFFDINHSSYYLPGAGMAYFLVKAIINNFNENDNYKKFKDEIKANYYLDLLALAIVADVVPLRGENRFLLKKGIKYLKKTKKNSLNKLFEMSGINKKLINEEDIAFKIAPIINAAGRLKSADIVVEMLLSKNQKKVEKLTNKLIKINDQRKKIQQKIIKEAEKIIETEKNFEDKAIILYRPHWHQGLLGIAAGYLSEKYKTPALLMTLKNDKKTITGSARSIAEININEQLKKAGNYLLSFGGHAGAAGFSLNRDKYTIFKKKLSSLLSEKLNKISKVETIEVDEQLKLSNISLEDYYNLRKLAPFGAENEKPLFLTKNCQLVESKNFSDNQHKRLIIKQNRAKMTAIWWRAGKEEIPDNLNLIYYLDINRFKGQKNLQLVIQNVIDANYSYQAYNEDNFLESIEIKDFRNWLKNKELKNKIYNLNNAVYYREGINKLEDVNKKKFQPEIDRYKVNSCNKLVILSFPPSLSVFKELIYNNKPSKIFLAFNKIDLNKNENFLNNLMSFLKYIILEKNCYLDISNAAVVTAESERLVKAGLKYLESAGYLEVEEINRNNYLLKRGGKSKNSKKRIHKNRLNTLLKESLSFKKFLFEVNTEELLKYINDN